MRFALTISKQSLMLNKKLNHMELRRKSSENRQIIANNREREQAKVRERSSSAKK